jgi:S-DNA-T family DNA segregation ATPase FtsK/SpoIIIE
LVSSGGRFDGTPAVDAAAIVIVMAGPESGREFPVPVGTSLIGRDPDCEVRLSDPLVSRHHAKIHVGDIVEVVDIGSSNGLMVGDDPSDRVILRSGDTVKIGESLLAVRLLAAPGRGRVQPSVIAFNRPPRIDPLYPGAELTAPQPPELPRSQRFPILPLFAPLILGVVLYMSTHSVASLIFVAMSPLLIVANAAEGRISGRKSYQAAVVLFREDVDDLVQEASGAQQEERARRLAEHPPVQECAAAAAGLTPLLWSRWPDLPGFVELRLGLGTQPSRTRIEVPSGSQNNRALWRELREAIAPFATVGPVPVVARFSDPDALGVAGPRDDALGVARAYVVQAACLHSPAELVLASLTSSQTGPAWEWVKWLPHCLSAQSPLSGFPLASTDSGCSTVLGELEQLVSDRDGGGKDAPRLPAVLVIIEDDAPVDRSRAVSLAQRGPVVGVHVLWVAPDTSLLPATCRTFVQVVASPGQSAVGFVQSADLVTPLTLEPIAEAAAEATARKLSAVVDAAARDDEQSELPRSVSLLKLAGSELANAPEAVIERWVESRSVLTGPMAVSARGRRPGTLRALIGETAAGPHILDLRTQGPHALVGGTTGSGKSELLQSWILGMALSNSPQRVTFLLVDYKGGSAFSECVNLPHTIGLVTDLSPHLVRRALTSLSAELRYREGVLHRKRAKDILELERVGDPDAPPSLVIVVDEFAALVQEVPEFVDGVVNVAQRGRSLGLHLILATQRPAGVIKDNLRANTNLRLALRVADEADSTDVLGSAEAASFDASIPGRAVSRTGPAQLVPFQSAYVGGWTSDTPASPAIEVETFGFGARHVWEVADDSEELEPEMQPTDIQRIVANIRFAHDKAQLPNPRLPWLPDLAPVYDLAGLPNRRRDDELVFGVADDPDHQEQPTVAFRPDQDGNLAVYGTGNSGKSTLLRTLAIAAGFTIRGGPCHVYGLDFGSRGLQMLEELPHVGSIVAGTDHERVGRLLTMLRFSIDDRAARYSRVGAGTITDYRRLANDADEARILLLVDGMGAFRTAYEGTEHSRLFEMFLAIAADGRPVGVHVILSADRPGALPSALGSQVQRRVVLRLADANDYAMLGLPTDVLDAKSPPGRGLLEDAEIQVAVLGKSTDVLDQATALRAFAESMCKAGAKSVPPIERLKETVWLSELPPELNGVPVFGLSGATLKAVGFEPRGTFSIAGPPGSGRTTALTTVIAALERWRPDVRLFYFGNRRSQVSGEFAWERRAVDAGEVGALASELPGLVEDVAPEKSPCVVVIEGLPDFINGPADFALQEMAKAITAGGHLLVSDGEPNALSGSYPLLVAARSGRSGIVLQPEQSDGFLLRSQFPRTRRADFPPGRGLYVPRGGQPMVVQVALPQTGGVLPIDGKDVDS